ncbi:phage protein Gp37 [Desulfuromonas sp. TF]|uniref:phage protein Gp37 n=1 Tax=Desulfuromonas sp. TF TaxID=1232410 RepID=UPI000422E1F0|nr:phage protein Gp37 [Desulfuromonas sp. TF]
MFDEIEDGLIAAIREGIPGLKTVESYAGQLEQEIKSLPARCPAVYVMFSGFGTSLDEYGAKTFKPRFTVLAATKDLRGQKEARTKTGGAYDLIKSLLTLLEDETLELEIEPLSVESCAQVFVSGSLTVYGLEVQTDYQS